MAAWKKVLCGECRGTGKIYPHKGGVETCPGCEGKGEILRNIEDIEREEAWEAVNREGEHKAKTPLRITIEDCEIGGCEDVLAVAENGNKTSLCWGCVNWRKNKAKVLGCSQEAKADAGKPRLSLVPTQIIYDIARVREYGDKKYGSTDNWKTVEKQRYVDAMYRHFLCFVEDPLSVDEESGLPHLWHLECNAAFLSEMYKSDFRG